MDKNKNSMISFKEAYKKVLEQKEFYGTEKVLFTSSLGRILAEDILADRDFPAFNRATKDGIAIHYSAIEQQRNAFPIEGIVAAGTQQVKLKDVSHCLEIMTGAVLPENTDTVVMYEDIHIGNGTATLQKEVKKGQNIHWQGSDTTKGTVVIKKNTQITAAEIGILAAVGKVEVLVKKLPKVTLISTGNELVAVHETPLPHQIRESNMLSLHALLEADKITPQHVHLKDDKEAITNSLRELLHSNDVLILSGGVSKGKYDYIPEAFEALKVEKVFHRVKQRPGKPFWFGVHPKTKTVIFSFPGNPVSTFANYHVYFKAWLAACMELSKKAMKVVLGEAVSNEVPLTVFKNVKLNDENGKKVAFLVTANGSGDLMSLAETDGFIQLPPQEMFEKGTVVRFVPTRNEFYK
ncbi:molybdopterin molybdotransferase MoeA [Galbibacter sp. PAP.153]|uniref:molybdopterin molybdotransferase MoeA n=1 Tax=Galbibacter sp. PAP.153 TaxID=3104623 RepID=UPI0030087D11